MNSYSIISLQDIDSLHHGTLYKDEIAVFSEVGGNELNIGSDEPLFVYAYSYMICLSGNARLCINDVEYEVNAGRMFLMQPLFLFQFTEVSNDYRCVFLAVTPHFADKIQDKELLHHIVNFIVAFSHPCVSITTSEHQTLKDCIYNIRDQIERKEHLYREQLIQNALIRFYLETDNIIDKMKNPTACMQEPTTHKPGSDTKTKHSIFQQLMSLVYLHYRKEHEVKFYADRLNVTVQYAALIMKRNTGRSLVMLIRELLYCDARNMLRLTDMSVQQIAWELCFADLPSFSKFFKKMSGKSPVEYRAMK